MKKSKKTKTSKQDLKSKTKPYRLKIPLIQGFEEQQIIETNSGEYIQIFKILSPDPKQALSYNKLIFEQKMEKLLTSFGNRFKIQFLAINRLIPTTQYLDTITVSDMDSLNPSPFEAPKQNVVDAYNNVLKEVVDVGHNNTHRDNYMVISYQAAIPNDVISADKSFKQIYTELVHQFDDIYGIQIKTLRLLEMLQLLYTYFNPRGIGFENRLDIGRGKCELKNLRYLKLGLRDLIAPNGWDTNNKYIDYSILNKQSKTPTFTRSFFIAHVSDSISDNTISELMSVSASMTYSIHMEQLCQDELLAAFEKSDEQNSVTIASNLRDTLENKKRRAIVNHQDLNIKNDRTYFTHQSLKVLKEHQSTDSRLFSCTMTITLTSDTLESLDNDSKLLEITASKLGCIIKRMDLNQRSGFISTLPLCFQDAACSIGLFSRTISLLTGINIKATGRYMGLYQGLNAINDNLILLNRKNNRNLTGIIAGSHHTGKSYQCQRDIINTYISTQDRINIVTTGNNYDALVKLMGGTIHNSIDTDIYEMVPNYGVAEDSMKYKEVFFNALYAMRKGDFTPSTATMSRESRVNLYKISSLEDLLRIMDYLWNRTITDKLTKITNWTYFDYIDGLLHSPLGADYLFSYVNKANQVRSILTFVIDETYRIIDNTEANVTLEILLKDSGFIKLLSLDPIERDFFTNTCNIPYSLRSHISNKGLSQGLILTDSSSIPFDDSVLPLNHPFNQLFKET